MNKARSGEFNVEGVSKKFENLAVSKDCVKDIEVNIGKIDLLGMMYSNIGPSFEEQLAISILQEFSFNTAKDECNKNKPGENK